MGADTPRLFADGRQVLETQAFTNQLSAIGPIDRLDEALAALQLLLTENAEVFDVLKGYTRTRLAKTRPIGDMPSFNVWYVIDKNDESVLLLYIEPVPAE